jgi:hypothetical protein
MLPKCVSIVEFVSIVHRPSSEAPGRVCPSSCDAILEVWGFPGGGQVKFRLLEISLIIWTHEKSARYPNDCLPRPDFWSFFLLNLSWNWFHSGRISHSVCMSRPQTPMDFISLLSRPLTTSISKIIRAILILSYSRSYSLLSWILLSGYNSHDLLAL